MGNNKSQYYLRLDDLTCGEWSPLTLNELRMLAPIKLTKGKVLIDRQLLARLLGERERLLMITELARWVAECFKATQLLDNDDYENACDLERAVALTIEALQTFDGDCDGQKIVGFDSSDVVAID